MKFCKELLAAALVFLLHLVVVEPQLHVPALHKKWPTTPIAKNNEYRASLLETVAAIRAHPFAQALHGLDHQGRSTAAHQLSQFVDSLNGTVSDFCYEDLNVFVTAIEEYVAALLNRSAQIEQETDFAVRQLDAFGKLPPGILELNVMFFGSYEECLRIDFPNDHTNRQYQGKFCTAYVPLQKTNCPRDLIDTTVRTGGSINWQWCLPNSCGKEDLPFIAKAVSFQNKSLVCGISCLEREFPMDTKAIIWTSVCGIFIALALLGTSLDIYWYQPKLNENKESGDKYSLNAGQRAMLAFSIYTNGVSVMDMSQKSGQIHCINCIRVFSIVWVMMGHAYGLVPFSDNLLDVKDIPQELATLTISNAYFSVDSFFFLSGLLLGFLFFKGMSKRPELMKKPSTWIMFCVHRYLRLTPMYVFVLAAYATMLPYWTGGMLWRQNDLMSQGCSKSWWANMLYINNYVERDNECMGVGWYLAADMQMHFVFAPIVLIAFWKSRIWGFVVSSILLLCSIAAAFYTTVHNHLNINILGSANDPEEVNGVYGVFMYNAAWIRVVPYLQGMVLGYILFMNGEKKIRIPWLANIIGWVVALSLMLTIIYGLHYTTQGHLLDLWTRAAYNGLSKPAWGFGLCWIVFSCYYGYGGVIGKFLSWHIWLPFSRLTYAAFLVHETILFVVLCQGNRPVHWSGHFEYLTTKLIPLVVCSYFIAFFASTMIEIPFGKLESQLFETRKRRIAAEDLPQTLNTINSEKNRTETSEIGNQQ